MKNDNKTCTNCANAIALPEGGVTCDVNNELVMDDYLPTSEYLWCFGEEFKEG